MSGLPPKRDWSSKGVKASRPPAGPRKVPTLLLLDILIARCIDFDGEGSVGGIIKRKHLAVATCCHSYSSSFSFMFIVSSVVFGKQASKLSPFFLARLLLVIAGLKSAS